MNKIAFIGAGNMSGAIIEGLLRSGTNPESVWATNRSSEKRAEWQQRGIHTSNDNSLALSDADVVVLGVKPMYMNDLLKELAPDIPANALVTTVAAGVPLANYEYFLPHNAICRVMPNTPCLLQTGVSGVYFNRRCSTDHEQLIEQLFAPLGLIHHCDTEAEIDLVIAAAGSAPAYFFLFMEAIIDAAVAQGMDPKTAARLVKQTALGAAKMVTESDVDPAELRRRVSSPGGTTERAIARFTSENLHGIVASAMLDCTHRASEMAELFKIDHGD